jgi:hypothetical protein
LPFAGRTDAPSGHASRARAEGPSILPANGAALDPRDARPSFIFHLPVLRPNGPTVLLSPVGETIGPVGRDIGVRGHPIPRTMSWAGQIVLRWSILGPRSNEIVPNVAKRYPRPFLSR